MDLWFSVSVFAQSNTEVASVYADAPLVDGSTLIRFLHTQHLLPFLYIQLQHSTRTGRDEGGQVASGPSFWCHCRGGMLQPMGVLCAQLPGNSLQGILVPNCNFMHLGTTVVLATHPIPLLPLSPFLSLTVSSQERGACFVSLWNCKLAVLLMTP